MRYFTVGAPMVRKDGFFGIISDMKTYFNTFLKQNTLPLFDNYEGAAKHRDQIDREANENRAEGSNPKISIVFTIDIADDSSSVPGDGNKPKHIQNDPLNITLLAGDRDPSGINLPRIYEFVSNVWKNGYRALSQWQDRSYYHRWDNGQTPREKTIHLLEDYARSRLGRLIPGQWRHQQIETARELIKALKGASVQASNEEIIDIIDTKPLTGFNHAGAFIDHVNFVILQLTHGKYNSLEEYRKFKKQDRVQAENGPEAISPGRRVVTKWKNSDIEKIKTLANRYKYDPSTSISPEAYCFKPGLIKHADALDKKLAATIFELEILKAISKDPNKKNQLSSPFNVQERAEELIKSAKQAIQSQPDRSFRKIRTPFKWPALGIIGLGALLFGVLGYLIILSIASGGILLPVIAALVGVLVLGTIAVAVKMLGHERADLVKSPTKPAIDYINNPDLAKEFGLKETSENDNTLSKNSNPPTGEQFYPSPIGGVNTKPGSNRGNFSETLKNENPTFVDNHQVKLVIN
jgi:hypothetical protein